MVKEETEMFRIHGRRVFEGKIRDIEYWVYCKKTDEFVAKFSTIKELIAFINEKEGA